MRVYEDLHPLTRWSIRMGRRFVRQIPTFMRLYRRLYWGLVVGEWSPPKNVIDYVLVGPELHWLHPLTREEVEIGQRLFAERCGEESPS